MFALFHTLGTYLYEKFRHHNDANWDKSYKPGLKHGGHKINVSERYIKLSDGHLISCDIYSPKRRNKKDLSVEKYPTILCGTRYNRAFEVKFPFNLLMGDRVLPFPQSRDLVPNLVSNGYVWVGFDARGTGASTGSRSFEWSRRDVQDVQEVVEWVERQKWFNGKIGAFGISFDGLIATNIYGAPSDAVKAACVLFPPLWLFDDVLCPGGTFLKGLFQLYSLFTSDIEQNRLPVNSDLIQTASKSHFAQDGTGLVKNGIQFALKYLVKGPMPVNGDRETLKKAMESRRGNYRGGQETSSMTFSDEPLQCLEKEGCDDHVENIIAPIRGKLDTHLYIITSWYDTFVTSALRLYSNILKEHGEEHAKKHLRLTIGPWSHAAMYNASPFVEHKGKMASFNLTLEMRRFFDFHLRGIDTGIQNDDNVHMYAAGLEKWLGGDIYPFISKEEEGKETEGKEKSSSSASSSSMSSSSSSSHLHRFDFSEMECNFELESRNSVKRHQSMFFAHYDIDYSISSSIRSRYNIISQFFQNIDYSAMQKTHASCLAFQSYPLTSSVLIDGKIRVVVNISVDHRDGVLFVYAIDVDQSGKWRYISEGHIRLLHRKGVILGEKKSSTGRDRKFSDTRISFSRMDSDSMVPYMPEKVELFLLPTSYHLKRGHSLKLVFAGADEYNFKNYKEIKSKWFRIYPHGSYVEFYELCL